MSEPCACKQWCDVDSRYRALTGHHVNCPNTPNPLDMAYDLIKELALAMDVWASDEDGIHPDAWEAYRKAKAIQEVILPPAEPPKEKSNPGVHATHCCAVCGCKYGDDDCPVVAGYEPQVYRCDHEQWW